MDDIWNDTNGEPLGITIGTGCEGPLYPEINWDGEEASNG